MRPITINEVTKHSYNRESKIKPSFWFIIHNNVYDVTGFLLEHPGGQGVILKYAGKDATQAFESVGHSKDARRLLETLKIGYLPEHQKDTTIGPCCSTLERPSSVCYGGPVPKPIPPPPEPRRVSFQDDSRFKWWWILALVAVLGGAFMVRKKMKGE